MKTIFELSNKARNNAGERVLNMMKGNKDQYLSVPVKELEKYCKDNNLTFDEKGNILSSFKSVGTWWNDPDIELVEIDGTVYALNGWNGETYLHCWICSGDFNMDASEQEYQISPIYSNDEEMEIIGYEVA